jgi:hypothetical protein
MLLMDALDHVCAFNDDALVDADYSEKLKPSKHAIAFLNTCSNRVCEWHSANHLSHFFSGLHEQFLHANGLLCGFRDSHHSRFEKFCDTLPYRNAT